MTTNKDRYDWKYMKATVVIKKRKRKKSLLQLLLKQRRNMYSEIDKSVSKRIKELSNKKNDY